MENSSLHQKHRFIVEKSVFIIKTKILHRNQGFLVKNIIFLQKPRFNFLRFNVEKIVFVRKIHILHRKWGFIAENTVAIYQATVKILFYLSVSRPAIHGQINRIRLSEFDKSDRVCLKNRWLGLLGLVLGLVLALGLTLTLTLTLIALIIFRGGGPTGKNQKIWSFEHDNFVEFDF